MSRRFIWIFTILMLVVSQHAVAACNLPGSGILDGMVTDFYNAATHWGSRITQETNTIFFILFGTEFMWQLAVKKVFSGDVEKLWVFFFTRTILCFFFAKYVVNFQLYADVIAGIVKIGTDLSGFAFNMNSSTPFASAHGSEPSILSTFSCVTDKIHQVTDITSSFDYIVIKITLALMQIIIMLALTVITYTLLAVVAQAYFLLYAGFLLVGFLGSSWTRDYWKRYTKAIASVAIKFLAICFIIGVVKSEAKNWIQLMAGSNSIAAIAENIVYITVSAILTAMVIHTLPDWAAENLSAEIQLATESFSDNHKSTMSSNSTASSIASKIANFASGGGASRTNANATASKINLNSNPSNNNAAQQSSTTLSPKPNIRDSDSLHKIFKDD